MISHLPHGVPVVALLSKVVRQLGKAELAGFLGILMDENLGSNTARRRRTLIHLPTCPWLATKFSLCLLTA